GRFEVTALSYGPRDDSPMRKRLIAGFDRFIEVREHSEQSGPRLMRGLEIDIAVDLKGFTTNCRPGILAFRPAPIQVNYLGHPGTMAAAAIDYLIADAFIAPACQRVH